MPPDSQFTPDVFSLIPSALTTPATRGALEMRVESPKNFPRFFDAAQIAVVEAAALRLVPPPTDEFPRFVCAAIDARLADGAGDGWRYDALPPDSEAWVKGLAGLDETSRALFQLDFAKLDADAQNSVLSAVRDGNPPGNVWQTLPASRFFEEFFAEIVHASYSHPLFLEQINYKGFADARGWQQIGNGLRERWEGETPLPVPLPLVRGEGEDAPSLSPSPLTKGRGTGSGVALTDSEVVVVVGTGAGGAPILARLAAAGVKVVALEAGTFWNPSTDFATDEKSQEKLFWNDERLSAGDDPVGFGANNSGTGVGGSTLHYTAYTPRAQPDDFRLKTDFGVGENWPLSYDDLEPYYDELEQFLGVSGPERYPWGPPRKTSYPLAPLPLNSAAKLMQRACESLGITTSPAANAALSGSWYQKGVGWRAACTNRGFCQAGCSVGAKASMDVTFIPLALSFGAEVRPECFVTNFERGASGQITGVVYSHQGVEKLQKCRAVFLCAGAVETPRLLLLHNLANGSGQVGRNFMAHTGVQLWGRVEDDVFPWKGIPGGLISEDTHRPKDADFAGGYLLQSIGVMPLTYATQAARALKIFGDDFARHMRGYNNTVGINILGDCLPSPVNFLELSDEKDLRGLPKPRVFFTAGDNEKAMTSHAERVMRQIFDAANVTDAWAFPRYAHTIGTCRMGDDPARSVVAPDGRAHEIPNLYLSDNSTFPSALSVNPALTIMALALRTADLFLARIKRGEG